MPVKPPKNLSKKERAAYGLLFLVVLAALVFYLVWCFAKLFLASFKIAATVYLIMVVIRLFFGSVAGTLDSKKSAQAFGWPLLLVKDLVGQQFHQSRRQKKLTKV